MLDSWENKALTVGAFARLLKVAEASPAPLTVGVGVGVGVATGIGAASVLTGELLGVSEAEMGTAMAMGIATGVAGGRTGLDGGVEAEVAVLPVV